jgi:Calcineurin-like phosphoesterase
MRRFLISALLLLSFSLPGPAGDLLLPLRNNSIRFAVIGDSGTGDKGQLEIGGQLADFRTKFLFEFVIMLGDNLYGGEGPGDYQRKFERPYKALLDAGVKFYASLGNHDNPNQRFYKLFNMDGQRYYSFKPQDRVRFFALDSNYMDKPQLAWLEKELRNSTEEWKICFFHHPLYSSGERHGPDLELRSVLEPLFVKYGVDVVFAGHEHFYERLKPQKGIQHFISGGAGKVRKSNIAVTGLTDKGFDQDLHFMLVEIDGDEFHFQAISRTGATVDSGLIRRQEKTSSRSGTSAIPILEFGSSPGPVIASMPVQVPA